MPKNSSANSSSALTRTELTEMFGELIVHIDKRFDLVDRRFDGIDERLDRIDQKVNRLSNRLDGVEDTSRIIKTKIGIK